MTKGMFVKFLVKITKYEGIALLHEDLYFFSELLDDTYQFLVSLPTRWIYMVTCFNFLSPYLYGGLIYPVIIGSPLFVKGPPLL